MKDGWKTSEFWSTVVLPTIGGLWLSYGHYIPAELSAKIVAFCIVAYAFLRTVLKAVAVIAPHTGTTIDDKIVEKGTKVLDAAEGAFKKK